MLDKWQVTCKLTVNYGTRYELPTVAYTINGVATELNPNQTALGRRNARLSFHESESQRVGATRRRKYRRGGKRRNEFPYHATHLPESCLR